MIARFAKWQGRKPQSIAADASYGNGECLNDQMTGEMDPNYKASHDALYDDFIHDITH